MRQGKLVEEANYTYIFVRPKSSRGPERYQSTLVQEIISLGIVHGKPNRGAMGKASPREAS